MLAAVHTVAEMAALGFDMDKDTFTNLFKVMGISYLQLYPGMLCIDADHSSNLLMCSSCQMGPHLLAPTGSDLGKFGKLGTVFASFHYGTASGPGLVSLSMCGS